MKVKEYRKLIKKFKSVFFVGIVIAGIFEGNVAAFHIIAEAVIIESSSNTEENLNIEIPESNLEEIAQSIMMMDVNFESGESESTIEDNTYLLETTEQETTTTESTTIEEIIETTICESTTTEKIMETTTTENTNQQETPVQEENLDIVQTISSWSEYELLAHVINAEAGSASCTDEERLWTGQVVLNRVQSPYFPSSMLEVILAEGQYGCVTNGAILRTPTEASYTAATQLLIAENRYLPENVLFQAGQNLNYPLYAITESNIYFYYLN